MLSNTVQETFDKPVVYGEIGVEVEVEGCKLPSFNDVSPYWDVVNEDSLRRRNIDDQAYEYVLRKPLTRFDVGDAIDLLYGKFDGDCEMYDSINGGIHIHVNCQQLTMVQVVNYICLYLMFEKNLMHWCNESRRGNLFCLSGSDASGLVTNLCNIISTERWDSLSMDDMRYAAINTKALYDYGSLEFRALHTTDRPEVVVTWIDFLLRLKDAAVRYDHPKQIIEDLSKKGPNKMFLSVFGDNTPLRFDYNGVIHGMRMAQDIAYCRKRWADEPKKKKKVEWKLPDEAFAFQKPVEQRAMKWFESIDSDYPQYNEVVSVLARHELSEESFWVMLDLYEQWLREGEGYDGDYYREVGVRL